jgi:hypothetical protein
MKPIIKVKDFKFFGKKTIGLTIFPFILLRKSYFDYYGESYLKETINHESIHIEQQKELLVVFFYFWYFGEFLIRRLFVNSDKAYKSISFEKEAYQNEKNLDYIKTRKFWSFIKYI